VETDRTILARQRFFAKPVHHPAWKKNMAGENEDRIIIILENLGYKEGRDYVRQHPIGERFVIDFAWVNEQVALEVDGGSHDDKKQKEKDRRRDSYLRTINWVPMRVRETDFEGFRGSFYKALIKEIVEERRAAWTVGNLYPVDFPNYVDQDFA
jgi:very-short-patch-repair endonuclease